MVTPCKGRWVPYEGLLRPIQRTRSLDVVKNGEEKLRSVMRGMPLPLSRGPFGGTTYHCRERPRSQSSKASQDGQNPPRQLCSVVCVPRQTPTVRADPALKQAFIRSAFLHSFDHIITPSLAPWFLSPERVHTC